MRKRNLFSLTFICLVVSALAIAGYIFFKDLDGPAVTVTPANGRVSPQGVLKIAMSDPAGIRSLLVGVRRNNTLNVIYDKHFDEYLKERTVDVPLKDAQLREGAFELEIRATDASLAGFGQGNTRTVPLAMRLDTRPPRITLKNLPPNVRRGGAGVIRYTIDEEVSRNGVLIGDYFVTGYLQRDGSYLCFFPFPYQMSAREFKNSVYVTATDMAGNETKNRLNVTALERTFKNDKLDLSDNFLQTVADKLRHLAPDAPNPLECYLYINNEVRKADAQMLQNLRNDSAAAMLWEGPFLRLPRSAPRAGFADHRYMSYQGRQVGESWHLGFDLASVRNDNVPAGNSGRVIFTGEQGIYGNLIVLDHGLGLQSLYSHLSEIAVRAGDVVGKGQIIGKTGSTGLAFGDHLHFGILVGGKEVTPLEWIDPKWIRDNVTLRTSGD
ncbi:MAG: M23 family metallopeptidase [Desulfovibrio sp.]|nr:M23 family metallopeptidase [Desulfovibrio sp.]